MKKILFLIALISLPAQAGLFGNYDDCVLDNMKEGLSTAGVLAVKQSCRNKYPSKPYVPEKCRDIMNSNEDGRTFNELFPQEACINKCLNASYWSKHFGDCKG